jgi:Kef-type K+ transport system membrane component KefB
MPDEALAYREPGIIKILTLSSFLLLLNLVGTILDKLIYCGLLGQLFIGVAWGAPGAQWLSIPTQEVFVKLGYLGLILLVYEGGLSTNFQALKSNLFLSVSVALTGIAAPIGISFVLMGLAGATLLQAFAAGAALCSTSLGTTFTVLKTSGLTQSRLGVVLTSAAILDDVVGLVMVQIISNLGVADSSFEAVTVIRPIAVSLAFAIVVPLVCGFAVKPLERRLRSLSKIILSFLSKEQLAFSVHTAILIGFVVASSYAGTSNLFAAYLAGASISWYDSEVVNVPDQSPEPQRPAAIDRGANAQDKADLRDSRGADAINSVSEHVAANKPHLLPSPAASENGDPIESKVEIKVDDHHKALQENDAVAVIPTNLARENSLELCKVGTGMSSWQLYFEIPVRNILKPLFFASIGFSIPISQMFAGSVIWRGVVYAVLMGLGKLLCGVWLVRFSSCSSPSEGPNPQAKGRKLPKPKSLYPASILGFAMVARGEIGFLISAVAESRGIFSSAGAEGSSELFLIVTWAIMLCTISGPIAVGLLTKRVRRLQEMERGSSGGREDPLGIWGVV